MPPASANDYVEGRPDELAEPDEVRVFLLIWTALVREPPLPVLEDTLSLDISSH